MIRLTFRENDKFGVVGMNEENQDKKLYSCVLKLLDYEETGLSPNEINKLKQQLEENNKEIMHLKDGLNMCKNIKRYDIGELLTENIKLKQNQIQLAIKELEKVKDFLFDMQAPASVIDGIDQQIKELENNKKD